MNMEENQKLTKKERRELRRQEKTLEELKNNRSKRIKKWLKMTAVLVAVIGIGGFIWWAASQPGVPKSDILSLKPDDWIKGNKDAKVTLIEYLDFECEACAQYFPLIKRLEEEFGNEVKFVVRYFPLPGHKNSMTSALSAETAGKQGKFWGMHDLLYTNQRSWGEKQKAEPTIFEGYARQLGLDMEKFNQDIELKEVKDRIERDKMEGTKLGIQGTPTFFLNGEKIQNPSGYDDFKALIQSAISKTTKESNVNN